MEMNSSFSAFAGFTLLVTGDVRTMLLKTKDYLDRGGREPVLIFDNQTGKQVDFNFQGTAEEVLARVMSPSPRKGPGRPKMGVISREVTLLPDHWDWLDRQPLKASGTLRRLVEAARKNRTAEEEARSRQEAAGRFLWSLAGNLEGFEEASRALYAGQWEKLEGHTASWPPDVKKHLAWMIRGSRRPSG